MVLTPLDIHNKEFPVKMRGYDQDEVNDYLDQIIKDYEMVLKENRELEKNLKFSEEKVTHYNNLQDALNKSIIVAQDAADRLKENAAKEAELIRLEAEKNADRLLDEAVVKAKKITTETDELRKQSRVFKQRLQLMIESQLEMVKNEEWEDILKPSQDEALAIPTLKEMLSSLEQKEDQEENEQLVESEREETTADQENDTDSAAAEQPTEGTMPAIELPNA
ncbi:DivIVA domain-containing protein [Carnobacterium sp.]|uniref:DivIVA domain-containing protein n=1 Tax=Carnobacterium sp. TaxID=48221 RepID=UPI0028A6DE32|nr:DivIVA domain-containing protein [Carnobacterium sp.]